MSDQSLIPKEDYEQRKVVEWLRTNGIHFFATVNQQQMSGVNRRAAMLVQGKLKALGLTPGVYDLCIFLSDRILFVEMKRVKGGVVSKHQKNWGKIANQFSYSEAIVCRGHEEAISAIKERILK